MRNINAPRETVDLSAHPNLVVIYLGMQVRGLRGLATVIKLGPQISRSVAEQPDGLLRHEQMFFSLWPLHVGMRQYWRDFESLEAWARSLPHQQWWKDFLRDPAGTGFWHETYFMRGSMEAIYINLADRIGLQHVGPAQSARGPMFSARTRAGVAGEARLPVVVGEDT